MKNKDYIKKPELMAPAGDWTMLVAAILNGANAIYFGTDKLNMRAKAKNFGEDDLKEIADYCHSHNVKSYLTLNSIVYEDELNEADNLIISAKSAGIDMIICWDTSVIQKCIEHQMPFAVSTQASVSNSAAVNFYKSLGAKRIVLARECSLKQIKKIRQLTDIEIEAFVHGAMCIAVSGRCFMSHHLFGKSANRGECIQPCRREYEVREFEIFDKEIDKSLIIGNDYVLSPKDLCTIEFLDKLIEAGIDSFKIEGRKRSPEYVAKVVSVYRKAIDLYFERDLTEEIKKSFLEELKTVYNRGFSSGFYFDVPSSEDYSPTYGSIATTKKEFIGKVINYFKQPKAAYIQIETGSLSAGDNILIIGKTSGVVEMQITKMLDEGIDISKAEKGSRVTFICEQQVRPNDMVYKVVEVPAL